MNQKTFFSFIFILILLTLIWAFKTEPTGEPLQTTTTAARRAVASADSQPTTAPVAVKQVVAEPQVQNVQSTVDQKAIDDAQSALVQQKQYLDTLKNRQAQQQQQISIQLPTQISSEQNEIANLSETLLEQRLAENEVNAAANAALQEQSSSAGVARDQTDTQIAFLEKNIQQMREQINYLSYTSFPNENSDTRAQYQDLLNNVAAQSQQLDLLRQNRVNISANVLQQTRVIQSLAQQQKADLTENRANIQDQVANLRNDIERLQTLHEQTRMSMIPLNQQIESAERMYQNQLQRVNDLQQSSATH